MALDPALERPHTSDDPAFSDAVTCVFVDQQAGVQGTIRLGLAGGVASGLMMVFADGTPAVAKAEGGIAVEGTPESYSELHLAGIDHAVVTPHERWTVNAAADGSTLELAFEAVGPSFRLDPAHETARWGGLEGYEQPCRVTGSVTLVGPGGSRRIPINGLGQRGHQWGAPDWSRLTVTRTITGWFGGDIAFNVSAMRPEGVESHADEISWASISRVPRPEPTEDEDHDGAVAVVEPASGALPQAVSTPEPRISTTMDESGRHIDATIELWESDEGPVWTATGEAIAGTTLELGRLRLDMAFFRWRMNGREGIGRYDILQRILEPAE